MTYLGQLVLLVYGGKNHNAFIIQSNRLYIGLHVQSSAEQEKGNATKHTKDMGTSPTECLH